MNGFVINSIFLLGDCCMAVCFAFGYRGYLPLLISLQVSIGDLLSTSLSVVCTFLFVHSEHVVGVVQPIEPICLLGLQNIHHLHSAIWLKWNNVVFTFFHNIPTLSFLWPSYLYLKIIYISISLWCQWLFSISVSLFSISINSFCIAAGFWCFYPLLFLRDAIILASLISELLLNTTNPVCNFILSVTALCPSFLTWHLVWMCHRL